MKVSPECKQTSRNTAEYNHKIQTLTEVSQGTTSTLSFIFIGQKHTSNSIQNYILGRKFKTTTNREQNSLYPRSLRVNIKLFYVYSSSKGRYNIAQQNSILCNPINRLTSHNIPRNWQNWWSTIKVSTFYCNRSLK